MTGDPGSAESKVRRHVKISGAVEAIEGSRWWARIWPDGDDLIAEMTAPLPDHAVEGSLFTIHTTKRGRTYIYWITEPRWTRNQVKRARKRGRDKAREWQEAFGW